MEGILTLINTGLQPGVEKQQGHSRFRGFPKLRKAVKTAELSRPPCTGLKPGANERRVSSETRTRPLPGALPTQSRHESRLSSTKVCAALTGEQFTINAHVADQHFQALVERVAYNLSVLHVLFVGERNAVGQ